MQIAGPRSSALLGGYTVLHAQLEQALARLKHTEDALLFSSGSSGLFEQLQTHVHGVNIAGGPGHRPSAGCHTRLDAAVTNILLLTHVLYTGFAANLSVLSAFASGADCAVFSDALNHASIVDGARLAAKGGAELHVYRYAQMP